MTQSPQKLGKYSLLRHLATGGMAEIWLAEQAGPGGFNKELVIKRILPTFADDSKFTTMFLDEARLAAQLSHPKIAQIYELGEIDGQYFIAMEYIQGIDLDVLLKMATDKDQPMPINIVCKIVVDVLEALDYAHDYTDRDGQPFNLVHRDVSPHNVLVSNDGIVKLCDFGVAKAKANQTKTQPGAVKGKFAYMAPEQIRNADDLDRRADVFAAGILFYELLTGVKPFGDELAAVNNIIAANHADPRSHRPEIPAPLVEVVDRALQKNRDDRYPDAHAMMRDIESHVRGTDGYVGDRELSRYVRTMQGLPLTRHSQPAIGVVGDESDADVPGIDGSGNGIDPLGETGEHDLFTNEESEAARDDRTTDVEKRVATAQIREGVAGPEHRSNTVAADEIIADDSGGHGKLIALFTFLILGIVLALGAVAYFVVGEPSTPQEPKQTSEKQEPQTKQDSPSANRSLLTHPGGQLVIISTKPTSSIWLDGELVASTPFQTTLRPGVYRAEFRTSNEAKTKSFKVENKASLQPITIDLND